MKKSELTLEISEYGEQVRSYSDDNYVRFMKTTKEIINEHLDKYSKQCTEEVKNISIRVYTNS